jgi:hemoglobin-like flavoprotein
MPVHRHPIVIAKQNQHLASIPIDHELVQRLRSSYELIRAHDMRLAETFYAKLFAVAPHLRSMFKSDLTTQAKKLTASLDAIVAGLADPSANAEMLAALGRRHAAYGAKPEHYAVVIDLLVESMRELLSDTPDAKTLEEWRVALRLIADQMLAASEATS